MSDAPSRASASPPQALRASATCSRIDVVRTLFACDATRRARPYGARSQRKAFSYAAHLQGRGQVPPAGCLKWGWEQLEVIVVAFGSVCVVFRSVFGSV